MINYISAFKSQMTFMGLHSEADNAKNESSVESNDGWILTKDQTELDIFIPANRDESTHVKENQSHPS